jgi:accessory gene regulator protein AgrB
MNPQQSSNNPKQPHSDGGTPYDQPVAYDSEGRPLYAHPPVRPTFATAEQPQVVHMTRAVDPVAIQISDDVKARHSDAMVKYPGLNLSEGEYIINEVSRHPIGLVAPIGLSALLVLAIIGGMLSYPFLQSNSTTNMPPFDSLILPAILLIVLVVLIGYITVTVYLNNKFYLTNESVVQEIQTSLFARREQTVSLANIEDASYRQTGILQTMFDYGSIRLSTEGDETTYRFYYVTNPKKQIATLNNAVEAFKNGRPVTGD